MKNKIKVKFIGMKVQITYDFKKGEDIIGDVDYEEIEMNLIK
jgi:hypothetical protein